MSVVAALFSSPWPVLLVSILFVRFHFVSHLPPLVPDVWRSAFLAVSVFCILGFRFFYFVDFSGVDFAGFSRYVWDYGYPARGVIFHISMFVLTPCSLFS